MRLVQCAAHGVLLHDGRQPVSARGSRALLETRQMLSGIASYIDRSRDDFLRKSERNRDAARVLERATVHAGSLVRLVGELGDEAAAARAAVKFAVGRLEGELTQADLKRAEMFAQTVKEQKLTPAAVAVMLNQAEAARDIGKLFALSLIPQYGPQASAVMERLAAPGLAAQAAELEADHKSVGNAVHAAAVGLGMLARMEKDQPGSSFQVKRCDPGWVLGALHGGATTLLGMTGAPDPEALPQEPVDGQTPDDLGAAAPKGAA